MKRKLFYLALFLCCVGNAQQLTNNNFESWISTNNGPEPQFWGYIYQGAFSYGTNNYVVGFNEGDPITTSYVSGAQAFGGSGKSVLLETKASVGQSLQNQGFTTIPGYLYREEPISGDIGSISFKYKSVVVVGDSCIVSVKTLDANGNTCSEGQFWIKQTNNSANWQSKTIILQDISNQQPVKLIIEAISTFDQQAAWNTPILGSKLYLDNFTLNYCVSPISTAVSTTICDYNLPYTWNGIVFNASGTQSAILYSQFGCDSVINMTLNVIPGPFTLIPDIGFETKLGQLGLDPCGIDGKVPTSLIQNISTLNLTGAFTPVINDLTGIEDFTALETLNISRSVWSTNSGVYITAPGGINLSQNIKLKHLKCTGCNLQQLDLSSNTQLISLDLGSWDIPPTQPMNTVPILNLSTNTNLTGIRANYCGIQNVVFPNTNNLMSIELDHNSISSFNMSQLTNLSRVDLSYNTLLDIMGNNCTQLRYLNLNYNTDLITLSGSEQYVDTLLINNCGFSGLNLSNCINLKTLDCSANNLNCLNLKNNSNNLINYINTTNNFTLTCIDVDDSTFSSNNPTWSSNKDPWSVYSENCAGNCLTSSIYEEHNSLFSVYPNPCENEIFITGDFTISNIKLSDLSGQDIYIDYTGNKVTITNVLNGIYILQFNTEDGRVLSKKINVIK